jgi:outer membrane protein assembly factor BamB
LHFLAHGRNTIVALGLLAAAGLSQGSAWPAWRGPLGTGEAPGADPPVRWSEEANVRWKVALPGAGNGSPIVWGELVFVLTAEAFGPAVAADPPPRPKPGGELKDFMRKIAPTRRQRFSIVALRRADGAIAWSRNAALALPHEGVHEDGSFAASTPVTDGEHVFAFFGSRGLFAYDLAGEPVWSRQLGEMERLGFGEGSSPALYGGAVVVQMDQQGPSFLIALDKSTGEELWRSARDEPTNWATPVIAEIDGAPQVVTNGTNRVRGYDLESGALLWECAGMTANAIPTPIVAGETAYLTSGFKGSVVMALRLAGATGDLAETGAVRWKRGRNTPYVPSPLLYGGQLYLLKANSGILGALDAKTGDPVFGPQRLPATPNVYASPVAAAERVYVVGRDGATEVLRHGTKYEVLAVNELDDAPFAATPALVDRELYLRGATHLYCLADDDDGSSGK